MRLLLLLAAVVPCAAQFRIGPAYFPDGRFPRIHIVIESGEATPATLRLLEDGKPTTFASRVIPFRGAGYPAAVLLLIDVSGSMRGGPIQAVRGGLSALMARARPADRVGIASFAEDLRWEHPFQSNSPPNPGVLSTRGRSTFLFDAVHSALKTFDADSSLPLRRRILLISDGFDEGSRASIESVSGLARSLRVPIDCVGVANPGFARWDILESIAKNSFGSFASAQTEFDLRLRVSEGLDALLDSPVAEFDAQTLSRDRAAHAIGVEFQIPSAPALRDYTTLTTPAPPWWNTPYVKTGALLLAALLFVYFLFEKSR